MKKRMLFSLLLIVSLTVSVLLLQSSVPLDGDDKKNNTTDSTAKVINQLKPSWNCLADLQGNLQLNKEQANKLLKGKLCIINPLNSKVANIRGYDLLYCEKGIFEDSTGVPSVVTECNVNSFNGDTIPLAWQQSFEERLFKGDSLVFDNFVINYDSKTYKLKQRLTLKIIQ